MKLLLTLASALILSIPVFSQSRANTEKFLFYSPHDGQLGSLSFINKETKIVTNGSDILLLDKNNLVTDKYTPPKEHAKDGFVQYILVLNDTLVSINFQGICYLMSVSNEKLTSIASYPLKQYKKKLGPFTYAFALPTGLSTVDTKTLKDSYQYTFSFYTDQDKLQYQTTIECPKSKNQWDYMAANIPHEYFFFEGKLIFYNKLCRELFTISINEKSTYSMAIPAKEEGILTNDVFFDMAQKAFYFIQYEKTEGKEALFKIYTLNSTTAEIELLNSFNWDISYFRGGLFNKEMFILGNFDGRRAWYLVPIDKVHEL